MNEAIGLREKKKARTKLRLLEIVVSMLREKTFDEIVVDAVCDQAEISKVTFFKYFSQKEELISYFMRVWCFRRTVESYDAARRGLTAVYRLFEEATRESANYPKARYMMISLVSFLSQLQYRPALFDLDKAEKMLLFPGNRDAWEWPVLTLDQLILKYLREAVADKELAGDFNLQFMTKALVTIFYGVPVSGVIFQESDIPGYYRMHLDLLLKR